MSDDRDYPKLENQPLTLVLAEFRINALNLDAGSSAAFRGAISDWLGVECIERVRQAVSFDQGGVRIDAGTYLCWDAPESGQWVQLEAQRLIYATARYPRFDRFSAQCREILSHLADVFEVRDLQRVGLRYNDCVVPDSDENLVNYLHSEFLPSAHIAKRRPVVRHGIETLLETETGQIAIRCMVGMHGLAVMPDVRQQFNSLPVDEVPVDRAVAVLDFDHFWQASTRKAVEFSVDAALGKLGELHKPARRAFWQVTTDYARSEKWR